MPTKAGEAASLVAKLGHKTRKRKTGATGRAVILEMLAAKRRLAVRRRRGLKLGGSIEEMQALVATSSVPVTKCPPGAHLGWVPSCLR